MGNARGRGGEGYIVSETALLCMVWYGMVWSCVSLRCVT